MQIQNGELYIQPKEVIEAGLSEQTFHDWRARTQPSSYKDGVESFVLFNELPAKWRVLINDYYQPSALRYAQFHLIAQVSILTDSDWQTIQDFSWELNGVSQKLSSTAKTEIEQAAKMLNWLVGIEKYNLQKYAVISMKELWALAIEFIKWHNIKLPTSRRLSEKIKQYTDDGAACLISEKYGNKNPSKILKPLTDDNETIDDAPTIGDLAIRLMQDDRKFSAKEVARQVWAILNERGIEVGSKKKGITYQAIWGHINTNAHLWALQRGGETAFRKERELRINARPLSMPHIQWQMDGTLFSVFYKNEQGKVDKLYAVIVMDTCSRAIIGWDISYTENTTATFNALKMAIKRTGYLPSELRTDKGAAFKSGEVQEMLKQLSIAWLPSRARNPKSRSIESQQNIWLNNIARYYPAYGGANITAQASDASHRSLEAMQNVRLNELGDKQSLIHCVIESICIHNAHRNDKGESANQRLKQATTARKMDGATLLEEFSVWRKKGARLTKYHLTPEGIEMEVNKMKFRYIPTGAEVAQADFMNSQLKNRAFYIKYDPTNLESILIYTLPEGKTESPENMRRIGEFILKGQSAQSFRDASQEEIDNFQHGMRLKKLQLERAKTEGDKISQLLSSTKVLERGLTFGDVHKEDYSEARREFEGIVNAGYADALIIDEFESLSKASSIKIGDKPTIFNKNKYLND